MSRYSDLAFIFNMDAESGVMLISEAVKQKQVENLYKLYVSLVPYMSSENYMSFDEFYEDSIDNSNYESKVYDKEEVYEDVRDILSYNIVGGE